LAGSLSGTSGNVIETPTGTYIVIGVTQDTLKNKTVSRLTLVGTDSQGNFLWRKSYGRYNFEYLNVISNGSVKDNNGFLISICVKDSVTPQFGALIKFNYNGDTLWQKKYKETLPDDLIALNFTKSVDGGYLITGFSQSTTGTRCLVLKTDINGNELWRKKIAKNAPNMNMGYSIVQDTVTKNLIITGLHYIGNSSSWTSQAMILILDSLGNNPIRKSIDNNNGGGLNNLIQLKDKNFIASGQWGVNPNYGTSMATLIKFDITGKTIWLRVFPEVNTGNVFGTTVELKNEDIAAIAFTDAVINPRRTEFLILNKNSQLKSRKYIGSAFYTQPPNQYATEAMPSMHLTSDKGFILSSWFPNKQAPHPYSIIKLDSTGCDTTEQWCTSVALGNEKLGMLNDKFKMFPNPATDVLNLELSNYAENKLQIKITDINGSVLENLELEPNQSFQLNSSAYSPGLYFVAISQNNSAVETRKLVIVR